jgi:hypothetical protein
MSNDDQKNNQTAKDMIMPLSLSALAVMFSMQAVESLAVLKTLDAKIAVLTEVISKVGICQKEVK